MGASALQATHLAYDLRCPLRVKTAELRVPALARYVPVGPACGMCRGGQRGVGRGEGCWSRPSHASAWASSRAAEQGMHLHLVHPFRVHGAEQPRLARAQVVQPQDPLRLGFLMGRLVGQSLLTLTARRPAGERESHQQDVRPWHHLGWHAARGSGMGGTHRHRGQHNWSAWGAPGPVVCSRG